MDMVQDTFPLEHLKQPPSVVIHVKKVLTYLFVMGISLPVFAISRSKSRLSQFLISRQIRAETK